MSNSIKISTISEWELIVDEVVKLQRNHRIFLLQGELGAGKTTFVKKFMERLNYELPVSSSTYSLINEYHASTKVYHMDLYRLKSETELWDIGMEDILLEEAIILAEWPELLENLLSEPYVKIHIEVMEEDVRNVVFYEIV